ncbi:MAG TPA: LptE family protein [Bacteroidota bacterium]|nr:LptE family protein [Bacteroidota bacterium]
MTRVLRCFAEMWKFTLLFAVATACAGCAYSFTGAAVPEHWKSIAIPLFDDESGYGQPSLRETLTNQLIEKVQSDNTLQLADQKSSSVEMRGVITSVLPDQPIAVSQGVQASRLQITLKVRVTLIDNIKRKEVWSRDFTASGDYPGSAGLSGRDAGLRLAMDNLTDDLLLETLSAW